MCQCPGQHWPAEDRVQLGHHRTSEPQKQPLWKAEGWVSRFSFLHPQTIPLFCPTPPPRPSAPRFSNWRSSCDLRPSTRTQSNCICPTCVSPDLAWGHHSCPPDKPQASTPFLNRNCLKTNRELKRSGKFQLPRIRVFLGLPSSRHTQLQQHIPERSGTDMKGEKKEVAGKRKGKGTQTLSL